MIKTVIDYDAANLKKKLIWGYCNRYVLYINVKAVLLNMCQVN